MNLSAMKAVQFEELPDDALFWMSKAEEPREPCEFAGPFKKKIYMEYRSERPERVFVKEGRPEAR